MAKVPVFSMSRRDDWMLADMRAGANDYLGKSDATEGLGGAIIRAHAGRFLVTESVARRIFGKISGLLGECQTETLPERKRYQ